MLSSLTSAKAALAAALGAGVLLTGGVGAAAAGVLPGAAQDTASNLLSKVGVTVPGADERSAGHAEERGASEDAGSGRELPDASDKGQKVAETAKSTELTGVDKGAAISGLASGGKSRAGERGGDDSSETADDAEHKPAGSTKADDDHADDADDADEAAEVKAEAAEDAGKDGRGGEERVDVEDADEADEADDAAEKADQADEHGTTGTTKQP